MFTQGWYSAAFPSGFCGWKIHSIRLGSHDCFWCKIGCSLCAKKQPFQHTFRHGFYSNFLRWIFPHGNSVDSASKNSSVNPALQFQNNVEDAEKLTHGVVLKFTTCQFMLWIRHGFPPLTVKILNEPTKKWIVADIAAFPAVTHNCFI